MNEWDMGYFTQLPYTYGYYREMAPAHLRFCLLQAGITPPPVQDFRYLELAMGQGVSAGIHAAANPGSFCGMDFMPEHALFARKMAKSTGNGLEVSDASFEEFAREDSGGYDYICLHGGWSWISAHNRAVIRDYLARHLKPGGVFYISYNCWPGWSATAPLRKLFTLFNHWYTNPGFPAEERIAASLTLTEEMLGCQPLFLNSSPWIMERFAGLKEQSASYLAHEFFNEDWHLTWFSDLARELADSRLAFAASAKPWANIPGFGYTQEAGSFLANIRNTVVREQLADFFCNTQFRTDIFIKGILPLADWEKAASRQKFIMAVLPEEVSYTMESGMGVYNLDKRLHEGIVNVLAENGFAPKSLRALHERLGNIASMRQIWDGVGRLVSGGSVLPCLDVPEKITQCATFNKYALTLPHLEYLASPATGSALKIKAEERGWLKQALNQGGLSENLPGESPPEKKAAKMKLLAAHGILAS